MRIAPVVPVALAALVAALSCASPLERPAAPLDAARVAPRATDGADADALWARRPDAAAVEDAAAAYVERALALEDAPDADDATEAAAARREALVGAVRALAWLAEHETDRERRGQHAEMALVAAMRGFDDHPDDPACRYWLAIGLGLSARERPARATAALRDMVELLEGVAADDPGLEQGGADRVLALVLLRAPGWPSGPGDPDRALVHARRAVEIDEGHPPNLLALAEALAETGRRAEARAAYGEALGAARALEAEGHPDAPGWARAAESGLSANAP